jgi:hypothetical protein
LLKSARRRTLQLPGLEAEFVLDEAGIYFNNVDLYIQLSGCHACPACRHYTPTATGNPVPGTLPERGWVVN